MAPIFNIIKILEVWQNQRYKVAEICVKGEMPKLGIGTDKQRQHKLELARIQLK